MIGPRTWTLVAAAAWLATTTHEAHALDLPAALGEVAAANPTLAGRREIVEASRLRVAPAGAWSAPMLELGAINVPTSGRFDQEPMTMKMVGLSQRLPLFGANGLRRRAAGAVAAAEGADLDQTGYELFARTWEAYADAYHSVRLVELSLGHRTTMDRLVRAARVRYTASRGRLEDVLRAEAEHARTLSDLLRFEAEAEGARGRLAALMGRPSIAPDDSLAPPPSTAPTNLTDAPGPDHPAFRVLRARADGYRLAARAARRMAWPDLEVGVSYGMREPIGGIEQSNLWSARVGLMLPLFAGSREFAEGAAMEAMARASEHELRAATLDLDQEVRSLSAMARAERRTVALLADTVLTTQRRAVAASWSAYDAGLSDLWRVFEATHTLYGEEVALVRARQALAHSEARLLALTAREDLFGLTLPTLPGSER